MYRVIIQSGSIECDDYHHTNNGVDLHRDEAFVAFVPYANLVAIVDEERTAADDRSIL
ncbi:MAG: hypothetical protein ABEJ73_12840 [Haloplanus sp.]